MTELATIVLYHSDSLLRRYLPDAGLYFICPRSTQTFKDEFSNPTGARLLASEDMWNWIPGDDSPHRSRCQPT